MRLLVISILLSACTKVPAVAIPLQTAIPCEVYSGTYTQEQAFKVAQAAMLGITSDMGCASKETAP